MIVVRSGSPCTLLQVAGPVTMHAAGALRAAMQKALAGRPAAVVVDLSDARVEDPRSAEAILVLMKRHARRLGADFIVASPPWLQRGGTTTILTTAPTLAAALEKGARLGRTAG